MTSYTDDIIAKLPIRNPSVERNNKSPKFRNTDQHHIYIYARGHIKYITIWYLYLNNRNNLYTILARELITMERYNSRRERAFARRRRGFAESNLYPNIRCENCASNTGPRTLRYIQAVADSDYHISNSNFDYNPEISPSDLSLWYIRLGHLCRRHREYMRLNFDDASIKRDIN